jgi:tetratricopeptide (TPR) repeat protein
MAKPEHTNGRYDAELLIAAILVYTTFELNFKFNSRKAIKVVDNINNPDFPAIIINAEITELVDLIKIYIESNYLLENHQGLKSKFNQPKLAKPIEKKYNHLELSEQQELQRQQNIKNAITCLTDLNLIKDYRPHRDNKTKRHFLLPLPFLLLDNSDIKKTLDQLFQNWEKNLESQNKSQQYLQLANQVILTFANNFPQEIYGYTQNTVKNLAPIIPQLKSLALHENSAKISLSILLNLIRLSIVTDQLKDAKDLLIISEQYLPKSKKDILSLAEYYHYLAVLNFQEGEYTQAEEYFNQEYKIRHQIFGDDHIELADTIHSQGGVYLATKKYAEAKKCFLRAIAMRKQHFSPEQKLQIANSLNGLGDVLYEEKNFLDAEKTYNTALQLTLQMNKNHSFLAYSKMGIANIKIQQNQYQIAAELYQQAILILRENYHHEHSELALPKAALAVIYLRCGHVEKGRKLYEEAIKILENNFGKKYYLIDLYKADLLAMVGEK